MAEVVSMEDSSVSSEFVTSNSMVYIGILWKPAPVNCVGTSCLPVSDYITCEYYYNEYG